ncbi:hypothetical protein V2J09_002179 [Rumex salicifolius]
MTNLRFFVLRPNHWFKDEDELKGVLEAPVMKNSGQLLNTPHLYVSAEVIVKEPTILSSLAAPPSSFSLTITSNEWYDSLTKVTIRNFNQNGDATISSLGKLPYLKHLTLYQCILGGNKMTFFCRWLSTANSPPPPNNEGVGGMGGRGQSPSQTPTFSAPTNPCIRGIETTTSAPALDHMILKVVLLNFNS